MRYSLTREFYIPNGARKVQHLHTTAVAYLYERDGKPYAVTFYGKSQKPTWHYHFANTAKREQRIAGFFASCLAHKHMQQARTAERKSAGRGLAEGDVLSAMWGYEQTNIDYYQVTKLIGDSMVEVRKIATDREETEWQQGKVVPMLGQFVGVVLRRKARNGSVRIDDVRQASKVEPMALIGGKPVYAAQHFTAYH